MSSCARYSAGRIFKKLFVFFCYNFLIYKKSYLFVTILLSCNFFFYTKCIYIFATEKDT